MQKCQRPRDQVVLWVAMEAVSMERTSEFEGILGDSEPHMCKKEKGYQTKKMWA